MDYSEKNMMDWSMKYKEPMHKDYQKGKDQYAGMPCDTLNYIARQDKHQKKAVSQIKSQEYNGRYS